MKIQLTTYLLTILFLSACSDSDDPDDSVQNISGVWDISIDDPDYGLDEVYLVINDDKELILYDYLGDEYDNYQSCYEQSYGIFIDGVPVTLDRYNEFTISETETDVEDGFTEVTTVDMQFQVYLPDSESINFRVVQWESTVTSTYNGQPQTAEMLFDLSVENELTFSFILNGSTSVITYEQDSDGDWVIESSDISHAGLNLHDIFENSPLPDFSITGSKYAGTESDFTPLCNTLLVAADKPDSKSSALIQVSKKLLNSL